MPDPSRPARRAREGPGPGRDKPPTGGLRGQTYELSNKYTYRDGSTGGGLERPSGPQKVSRAMAGLKRLDANANVKAATKDGLAFTVSVPDPANRRRASTSRSRS